MTGDRKKARGKRQEARGKRQETRGKRQKIILPFFSLMIQKRLFNLDFTGFLLFPVSCFLFPVSCFLFPVSCFLFPVYCSLFTVPCSLRMSKSENKCYKILRAVINAQHNTGQYFAGGN
ncbi:MAG: CsbD family protein [Aphanizomenon flos-aquae KM1D3_PB]|uniref:CsbD family protein n=1 Tax=Aphanizomenon flos-aquae TaxID=1176 RepID=UPI000541BA48|nr:CsbD family protein [Aphanizomenon flos-aquae]KHG40159.1 hypothetical protein OA07_19165 [Aphanizomenon flos-aquae 2012/KM1/D3]QSV69335.1 MAG: CsbD family protein [Aphanizomenon flos-aquae KM1D3_PB]